MNPMTRFAAAALLAGLPGAASAQGATLEALVAQLEADPAKVDYPMLWRAFRAEAELSVVMPSFDVLEPLQYPDGLSADGCAAQADALSAALRTNPVSLALRHAALACAELGDDTALAARHEAVLGGLLATAVAGGRGASSNRPVPISAEIDVVGFAKAAGLQIDGAYHLSGVQPRLLPLHVLLSDPAAGTERDLEFDFFDVWLDLSRAEPESAYPIYGMGSATQYLEHSAESGNVGARIALALRANRSTPEGREQATGILRGAIAAGSDAATLLLAEACFTAPDLWSCEGHEVDGALELAEKGSGRALVLLAAAYTAGVGVKRDAGSAARLLERAEQKLGVKEANERLAELVAGRELRDDDLGRIGTQALRKAVEAGSPSAMRMLGASIEAGEARALDDGEAARLLERAAAEGDSIAAGVLAYRAMQASDYATARKHLQRAVDLGDGVAAGQLAVLHSSGRGGPVDRATARRLREFAAWRGFAASARVLAFNHLPGGLDGIDYDKARRWLAGAAVRGDTAAMAKLAELDIEGLGTGHDLERGARLFRQLAAQGVDEGRLGAARAVLARGTDPAAMRSAAKTIRSMAKDDFREAALEYARLLLAGRGVEADLDEALIWYRRTMDKGFQASDEFVFGMLLLSGPVAQQQPKRAREVFDRVTQRGRPNEINDIAWRLCVSRNDEFRDPPTGLALSQRVEDATMKAVDHSTRAACLAATGDFERARAMQRAGLEKVVAEDPENVGRIEAFHARLAFYERDAPWRE
jgi:TPR repeat protein